MPNIYDWLASAQQGMGEYLPGFKSVPKGEQLAQYELARAGSIMAQPQKAEWRKESPLLDTLLGGAVDALKNPLENIGGPGQAVFGPIGKSTSPILNRIQKHLAKALFRGDPEIADMARSSPKMFALNAPGVGMSEQFAQGLTGSGRNADLLNKSFGVHHQVSPNLSSILINPSVLKGRAPMAGPDAIYGSQRVGTLPDLVGTVLHEVTHGFGRPLTTGMNRGNAAKLNKVIEPHLSDSFYSAVQREYPFEQRMANESLSYLAEAAYKSPPGSEARQLFSALKPLMREATNQPLQPAESKEIFYRQLLKNTQGK